MSRGGQHQAAAAARDERVERRLRAVAVGGRAARRGSRSVSRSQASSADCSRISRCSGVAHWSEDLVDLRQRRVERLALLGPLDQRGDLDQLEVARHRLVDVQVGVEPHLAEPAADPRDRVEQLVAHDPEGRVEPLGRPEQLLLELLLLEPRAPRAPPRRTARAAAWRRAGAASRPRQHEALARARHRHVQQPAHLRLVRLARRSPAGRRSLSSSSGTPSAGAPERSRHARRRQAQHEDVVELEALGRVHRHHLHRAARPACRRPRPRAGPTPRPRRGSG